MAGGGGGGTLWVKILAFGAVLLAAAYGMEFAEVHSPIVLGALLAVGGLCVVFGSCESMIVCVEGVGKRQKWNHFVAGTIAGIAANLPEVVMLGFVLAAQPRVGFIVLLFTVHVGAMAFGVYSGLLPRDADGNAAKLPEPLIKLSTDLYACAAGVFLTLGVLMICKQEFSDAEHPIGLSTTDLFVLGGLLLMVQIVAITQLVKRFSGTDDDEVGEAEEELPSIGRLAFFGGLGIATSVLGGHAVGEFADMLVSALSERGYSEMVGALILSVFACAGAYAMIGAAHVKGMYDIAIANVSGSVTQQPFLVMPLAFMMLGVFGLTGVIPMLPGGFVMPIDLQTTSIIALGFAPLLILWKAVSDDGRVNWVETAGMIAVFGLTIYFLATER